MTTLFLICFLIGVGFSAVSLLSMFGHGFHHHGHGGGTHVNGHHVHGHHADSHQHAVVKAAADLDQASAPLLMRVNIAAVVVFLACFGGIGLLTTQLTSAAWIAPAVAVIAGIGGSALINRVIGSLVARETPLEAVTLPGTYAHVTMPIREGGGTGEIVYAIDGTRRCSGARSNDGRPVEKGSEVVILRYDKGIAYVSTLDNFSPRMESPQ